MFYGHQHSSFNSPLQCYGCVKHTWCALMSAGAVTELWEHTGIAASPCSLHKWETFCWLSWAVAELLCHHFPTDEFLLWSCFAESLKIQPGNTLCFLEVSVTSLAAHSSGEECGAHPAAAAGCWVCCLLRGVICGQISPRQFLTPVASLQNLCKIKKVQKVRDSFLAHYHTAKHLQSSILGFYIWRLSYFGWCVISLNYCSSDGVRVMPPFLELQRYGSLELCISSL